MNHPTACFVALILAAALVAFLSACARGPEDAGTAAPAPVAAASSDSPAAPEATSTTLAAVPDATPTKSAALAWHRVVADDPAARTCTVEVGGDRQTFHGFGTSAFDCNQWTRTAPAGLHRELARETWGDGGLRILRVWLFMQDAMKPDGTLDLGDFTTRYIDSHVIDEAVAAGCTAIQLVPACMPAHLRLAKPEPIPVQGSGHAESRVISDAGVVAMMGAVAEAIARIKKSHGIAITATGIMNEPNQDSGFSGFIATAQTPLAVKALRRALDERTLGEVAIIAPETSSVDWTFDERVAALRADPEAWAALSGIAWHSYNMAMRPGVSEQMLPAGKDLWMTEASANGAEQPNDRVAAASMAARIANDLRNGCTHWLWFLAYEGHDANDDQTRLIRVFQERAPVTVEKLGKFHPLKDLCAAFPPGSRVLATIGSPTLEAWTYGRKPPLQAVAARRPDGGLALAAVNFTSASFPAADAKGNFELENAGLPAETLRVVWRLPVLEGVARVCRRDADLATAIDEVVQVREGRLALVLRPLEIVTVVVTP